MRQVFVFRDGKVVDRAEAGPHPREIRRSVNVVSDLDPFVSMVDGSVIGSRTDRRAHNKRNGVIDVGDDKTVFKRKAPHQPAGVGEDIKRAIEECQSRG